MKGIHVGISGWRYAKDFHTDHSYNDSAVSAHRGARRLPEKLGMADLQAQPGRLSGEFL